MPSYTRYNSKENQSFQVKNNHRPLPHTPKSSFEFIVLALLQYEETDGAIRLPDQSCLRNMGGPDLEHAAFFAFSFVGILLLVLSKIT
jgi:hypothetical protein